MPYMAQKHNLNIYKVYCNAVGQLLNLCKAMKCEKRLESNFRIFYVAHDHTFSSLYLNLTIFTDENTNAELMIDRTYTKMILLAVLCVLFCTATIIVFNIINNTQSKAYMDEIFHVPQAQQYCDANFTSVSKMTLYVLSNFRTCTHSEYYVIDFRTLKMLCD